MGDDAKTREVVARWFRSFSTTITRRDSLEVAAEIIGVIDQEREARGLVVVSAKATDAMVEAGGAALTEARLAAHRDGLHIGMARDEARIALDAALAQAQETG